MFKIPLFYSFASGYKDLRAKTPDTVERWFMFSGSPTNTQEILGTQDCWGSEPNLAGVPDKNSSMDFQRKYKKNGVQMLRRRTAQQSDEDNLEHRLSAQQYQGSDGAQVVWIRVNEQNCWELLIGCRLAGNRAGLRSVMTNSCATVGTKKTGEGRREFVISCNCGTEPRTSYSLHQSNGPLSLKAAPDASFQGQHIAKRIALERMVRQWVWKSANTRPLHHLLLTSRLMTSSVGWTASFNSSRFRLSAAFQTVWAGSCEGCSPSIRAHRTRPQKQKRMNIKNVMKARTGMNLVQLFCVFATNFVDTWWPNGKVQVFDGWPLASFSIRRLCPSLAVHFEQ